MVKRIALFFLLLAGIPGAKAQVTLQTGAAQFSVPLYSYTDATSRLSTDVTLVYTSGNGLKVNEIPSSVGAGWDIRAGGFIQRIQHGEPDDQKYEDPYVYPSGIFTSQQEFDFRTWRNNYYPNGYLYSEYSPTDPVINGGAYTPMFSVRNYPYKPHPKYMADLEQDVFLFSFNGKSGYFIIGKKDQNNINPIRTLYDSKLKIEKVDGDLNNPNNILTTISEFQITDDDGIKYIFKDAEMSQVCVYDKKDIYNPDGTPHDLSDFGYVYYPGQDPPPNPNLDVFRANTKNKFIKNKWYLSEIINPLTGKKIVYEYENYDIDMEGRKTARSSTGNDRTEMSLLIERNKGTCKRLKNIVLSTMQSIEFMYSNVNRIDITTDKALDHIALKYNGMVKQNWEFETGYFVKQQIKAANASYTTEEKMWARLCLLKLKKTSPTGLSEPPYAFDYYLGTEDGLNSNVPPIFSFYQDLWGYYNPHRMVSGSYPEPYGGNLLPKSIYKSYLGTTGTAIFHRGPNLDSRSGALKRATNPMGGSMEFGYENNYWQLTGSGYLGSGGLRVNKIVQYDGIDHLKDNITEYKYVKEDGVTTSAWGSDSHVFETNTVLRIYKKCGGQQFPGIDYPQLAIAFLGSWAGAPNLLAASAATLPIAIGLILKEVIVSIIIDLITSDWEEYTLNEYNSDLPSGHNLLPFQYARVEVVNKLAAGTVGKTVYEYTSPADADPLFAIDFPTIPAPYSSRQRCADWLYGLPRIISTFDKDGKLITKTENKYKPFKYFLVDPKFASQTWKPAKHTFACSFSPTNGTGTADITSVIYYPICGRIELESKDEYFYNSLNQSRIATTKYEYSLNDFQLRKTLSNNSKGEEIEMDNYYAGDYTLPGVIQTMIANNMYSVPISTQTFLKKAVNQKYLLSGSVYEYGVTGDGDIKPTNTYTSRITDPVISTSVAFNAAQLLPGSGIYQHTGGIIYSATGDPVQINSENGNVSTMYDYDKKIAVASVINANYTDIAYTSFEADGAGGWSFELSKIIREVGATGRKCLKTTSLKESAISRTIVSGKKYTLSFWSKGSVPSVTGATATLIKSWVNPGTGYTYYEYEVSNGTSISITNLVTGPVNTFSVYTIDEVRLYPVGARMTTLTFDPFIGKTSECDENGRIIYYEYDALGRLRLARDENRNVIKTYEYNYKQ